MNSSVQESPKLRFFDTRVNEIGKGVREVLKHKVYLIELATKLLFEDMELVDDVDDVGVFQFGSDLVLAMLLIELCLVCDTDFFKQHTQSWVSLTC